MYDYVRRYVDAHDKCAGGAARGGHKAMIDRLLADGINLTAFVAAEAAAHSLDMLKYVAARGTPDIF